MMSHYWSQTPRVGSPAVFQSYQMALSPVYFSPMSAPQLNLTMCRQQNLFPFSPILSLLQESPQKKKLYLFSLQYPVITPLLLAAG
jgi:hypothetical protein